MRWYRKSAVDSNHRFKRYSNLWMIKYLQTYQEQLYLEIQQPSNSTTTNLLNTKHGLNNRIEYVLIIQSLSILLPRFMMRLIGFTLETMYPSTTKNKFGSIKAKELRNYMDRMMWCSLGTYLERELTHYMTTLWYRIVSKLFNKESKQQHLMNWLFRKNDYSSNRNRSNSRGSSRLIQPL